MIHDEMIARYSIVNYDLIPAFLTQLATKIVDLQGFFLVMTGGLCWRYTASWAEIGSEAEVGQFPVAEI